MEEHKPTLIEYASKMGVDVELLHKLVAAAKHSDSDVIRFGAVAMKDVKIIGTGCNRVAKTDDEKAWADDRGLLHGETAALLDAQSKGYNIEGATIYNVAISPEADKEGHLVLRGGDHPPCFSCASCAPQLAKHNVSMNLLHAQKGFVHVSANKLVEQGEYAAKREAETGQKVRAGQIPGSSRTADALKEPGYEFEVFPIAELDKINDIPMLCQRHLYSRINELEQRLQQAWVEESSSYEGKGWSADNPSYGQCAVTAALVQEVLGGDIVRVVTDDRGMKDSHYFNILPNGQRVDFTYRQFSPDVTFEPPLEQSNDALLKQTHDYVAAKGFEGSVHDYVLSVPATKARFDVLKAGYRAAEIESQASSRSA